MWFQKNKRKIIVPVLIIAVLATAFYFGGNAPGSKGWEVGGNAVSDSGGKTDETVDSNSSDLNKGQQDQTTNTEDESGEKQNIAADAPNEGEMTPPEEPDKQEDAAGSTNTEMVIDPETGKDRYQTDPVPEGKPIPVEPQDAVISDTAYTCTISISCATILDNLDLCDPDKVELVPEDGWILQPVTVTFYEGESVFNVLQRSCKQNKIHMEYEDTPIYNSAYIEGIHNLYEFDVGELSGWMYQVNGWFPNYGCSRYQLQNGDVIEWEYTCDLGADVGGNYALGGNVRAE